MPKKRLLFCLLATTCAAIASGPVFSANDGAASNQPIALDGVTIVDTRTGRLTVGQSVIVDNGKIVAVTKTGQAHLGQDVHHINARGKFVVPGYLDMHAHPLDPADPKVSLPLMLSYGVTGFRQMGGSPELLKKKREGTLPHGAVATALVIPGRVLAGPSVATPDKARAVVRQQHLDGADFIKAVDMPPAAYFAAMDEAKQLGMPFVGHLPPSIDVRAAVTDGMKSIEHLGPHVSILEACSKDENAIRAQIRSIPPGGSKINFNLSHEVVQRLTANPVLLTPKELYPIFDHVLDSYDEAKCLALAHIFISAHNWEVPTLIREKSMYFGNDPYFRGDKRLRYIPTATRQLWMEVGTDFDTKLTAAQKQTFKRLFERDMKLVKLFDTAGVKMLAGSDMGGIWLVPGLSLHQEFDLLAQAGLSPLRILQMTTLYGAQFLHREATMGTIEPGKIADMVLLDRNPIANAENLHAIAAVVHDGHYFSKSDLEAMRQKVAMEAKKQL